MCFILLDSHVQTPELIASVAELFAVLGFESHIESSMHFEKVLQCLRGRLRKRRLVHGLLLQTKTHPHVEQQNKNNLRGNTEAIESQPGLHSERAGGAGRPVATTKHHGIRAMTGQE